MCPHSPPMAAGSCAGTEDEEMLDGAYRVWKEGQEEKLRGECAVVMCHWTIGDLFSGSGVCHAW